MTLLSLLLHLVLLFYQPKIYPLNDKKEPTSKGIELYIKENETNFISEFQTIVKDTLYDVYIYTEDLSLSLNDSLNLGVFYVPNEIIITTEEKFIAYELKNLSKSERTSYISVNNFVKSTVFHELMHYYFNQVMMEMLIKNQSISNEYTNFSMFPKIYGFGSKFIEEGLCEYFTVKNEECIFPKKYYKPKNLEDITNKQNQNLILYEYSAEYVRSFVDYYGYKKAIILLVSTKPPTIEEILYPDKFFSKFSK